GALVGDARRGRLSAAHLEHRAEHVVHSEEGGGHAGARSQELAPAQAVPGREIGRELLHPGLDAALLAGLRQRVVLPVRDDLRGNWASKGGDLGGCGALQFRVAEIVGHRVPPSARSPGLRQASSLLAASPGLAADSWTTTPLAWGKSSGRAPAARASGEP